jgi:hypothetical protein
MTMTQKRWFEIPILLLIIWVSQAVELSLFPLPYYLGTPQLFSLMVAYVAFCRGWTSTAVISFLLAFLCSANVGYPTGLFIAAHLWSALSSRAVVSAFTLEGRPAFVIVVTGYSLFLKILTWSLLKSLDASPTLPLFFAQFFSQTALLAAAAWIIYPLFRKWDDYFLHTLDDDSLSPRMILK